MKSFPPKKILVPMDLSDASMEAWRTAYALARQFKAACEAAYIQQFPLIIDMGYPPLYPVKEIQQESLSLLRKKIGGGPHIHTVVGDPGINILKLARKRCNDLIVMGTHGRRGMGRFFMGSVSEEITRTSHVPVLTAKGRLTAVKRILVPVNFTEYSTQSYEYAESFAEFFDAEITALHVVENKNLPGNPWKKIEGLTRDFASKRRQKLKLAVRQGEALQTILKETKGHDLILLSAHRKSLLKDTILGTTAERVLRYSPIPVLAVPSEESAVSSNGTRKSARATA